MHRTVLGTMSRSVVVHPAVDRDTLVSIDKANEKYHEEMREAALLRIKQAYQDGKLLNAAIVKYVTDGKERFRDDLMAFWQTIALVGALTGAIAVTILLASPSKQEYLLENDYRLSETRTKVIVQMYYALFGAAAITEIGAVLVVTVATVHFNLMVSDDDMIWFVYNWNWFCLEFCQVLMTVGCFSLIIGCMVGAFIVGDNNTGIIVITIGISVAIVFLPSWLFMIAVNKRREKEGVDRVRDILFSP